ncbi:MAG: hypothetical protein C0404_03155, partial [Verrucomicrobia bacterium]|nr:hypothetical protein [Verrucomicrobiota bacterium]
LRCIVILPFLLYLDDKLGKDQAVKVIESTGMDISHVRDANNWISFDYYCRFLRTIADIAGYPDAVFFIARQYTDKRTWGSMSQFLVHLGSPSSLFKLVVQFNRLWNRICDFSLRHHDARTCTFSMRYPRHKQDRNNCLAVQGSIAAAPGALGLPYAKVEELQCACNGEDSCVYKVTWVNKPTRLWGAIGFAAGSAIGAAAGFMSGWDIHTLVVPLALAATGYFMGRLLDYKLRLKDVYRQNEEQANSLLESMRAAEKLNEELQERVDLRTSELSKANAELSAALSELKESQRKLLDAEKHSAIGILAAGMAHEVNNPLSAVIMCIQTISKHVAGNPNTATHINLAISAAARCRRIVNELLAFSRDPQMMRHSEASAIIEETVDLFVAEHPGGISVSREIVEPLPAVVLDKWQIQQALMNILVNAFEAMKGKGVIRVAMKQDKDNLLITIADDGPGMTREFRERVFEPFHTSKAHGRGHGLGLAITVQLVRRNGGQITVESTVGTGTTFLIRFPAGSSAKTQP